MTRSIQQTTVVITMAGAGSRFREAGYMVPKYEIEVHGRTLFAWSMESLRGFIDAGSEFVFVARSHENVRDFIAAECARIGIRIYRVHTLDDLTDGQATTAMTAQPHPDLPVAIYNIDTYVDPAALDLSGIRGQGWIPCFGGEGDKWSFAAADDNGLVSELREKKRISPHATIGLYWFDSFKRYAFAYQSYYSKPENLEAKERYIAPLYNQLIQDGAQVYIDIVPPSEVYPLGTPADVLQFASRPVQTREFSVVR